MAARISKRLLVIRPDAYGDIVLFEPALRILREAWPKTEIAVLIQERYQDIAPVVGARMRWLTTQCNPYCEGPDANPKAFESLRRQVIDFAPDCVVAACYNKTWMEAVVASFAPTARQISLGAYELDLISKMTLQGMCGIDWAAIYPEVVATERDTGEVEKNLHLARHLVGEDAPSRPPTVGVSEAAVRDSLAVLRGLGMEPLSFVACCPAGNAKVVIKSWPADRFGEIAAWIEKTHGIRTLLLGHENELAVLEVAAQTARARGAAPAIWTGSDGQIALLTALLQASRLYVGNDTGAMHLAAALDKPVVAIFGGGHWPRFKPVAKRAVCVVQPLPCFGCDWECYFGDAPCVKTILVDTVKQAVDRLMTTTGELREDIIADGRMATTELELISKVTETAKSTRHISVVEPPGQPEALPRATLQRLIEQLQFSEADRAARLDVIQRQGVEIGELLQSRGHSAEQNVALLARMEKLQAELGDSRSHAAAQAQIIESQMTELEQLRTELRRAQEERVRLEQHAAAQAQVIQSRSAELEQLRTELRRAQEERVRLEQHAAAQAQVIQSRSAELEQLRTELRRAQEERIRLEQHAAAQAQVIQSRSAELEQLRTELRRAREERVRLEQHAAAQAQVIQSQSAELEQLRTELRRAREERVRLEQHAAMQSNALDGAVKSLEAARARVKELQLQLLDIDRRWLVRVLKWCGLWRK